MNQPRDISLSDDYAGICGITESEMVNTFKPEIGQLYIKKKLTQQECMHRLHRIYDGYHFAKESPGMYNPFSLLNAFVDKDFGRYWFSTATPSFLISKLKKSKRSIEDLVSGVRAEEDTLRNYRDDNFDPIPLLHQSGYLMISGWHEDYRVYDLKFPNEEVQYGFMNALADAIAPSDENRTGFIVMDYVEDLKKDI